MQVVAGLGEHLDARVLDLGRLRRCALQGTCLLDHDRALALDFLRERAGMQAAVDREAEEAALEVVAKALVVVVQRRVRVVVAVRTAVRDDVESRDLLVAGDRPDGVFEGLALHRIRRLLIAREEPGVVTVPPAGVRIVTHHAGRDQDLLVANLHLHLSGNWSRWDRTIHSGSSSRGEVRCSFRSHLLLVIPVLLTYPHLLMHMQYHRWAVKG